MFQRPEEVVAEVARVFAEKSPALRAYIENHQRKVEEVMAALRGLNLPPDGDTSNSYSSAAADRFGYTHEAIGRELARLLRRRDAERSLKKDLLQPLGNPSPLDLRELWELADKHLCSTDSVYLDIDALQSAIVDRLREFRLPGREVAVARAVPDWPRRAPSLPIWSNDSFQVTIRVRKTRSRNPFRYLLGILKDYEPRLSAQISGWVSERAAQGLVPVVRRAVRAGLWAASDLHNQWPPTPRDGATAPGTVLEAEEKLAPVSQDLLATSGDFLRHFLTAFWGPRPKSYGDSAVHNAVRFLVEANAQRDHLISIVHYCTSLEALVGGGPAGVTKTLSENVATLLEPDRLVRPDAVRLVKSIYEQRSRSVHGDSREGEGSDRARARALCAHVLAAVMERRQFDSRIGARPKSSAEDPLLRELESARLTGQSVVGVTPSAAARSLWGNGKSAQRG